MSHVAFYVHDLAAAKTFYRAVLGYGDPAPVRGSDGRERLDVWVNDKQHVELIPETVAGSDRLGTIAFETDDADALRRYLGARGVSVPEKVVDDVDTRTFAASDPDGHAIAFIQRIGPARMMRRTNAPIGAAVSTDLRHVGIVVGALGRAMAFYGDTLGFKEIWRGSRDEKELSWVNMQVPDGADYVEFMLYRDVPRPDMRLSLHHICLFVPDAPRSLSVLRQRATESGYTRSVEMRLGVNRKRQINLFDPDGTRIELMEPFPFDGRPAPSSHAPPPHP